MPKLSRSALEGRRGIARYSASQLETWASRLESQATDPENKDDPRWLKHWSDRMRRLAKDKRRATQAKQMSRRNPK